MESKISFPYADIWFDMPKCKFVLKKMCKPILHEVEKS